MGRNVHPSVHIEIAKRGLGSFDHLLGTRFSGGRVSLENLSLHFPALLGVLPFAPPFRFPPIPALVKYPDPYH